ncbi:BTB/POZ domain-containing protein [Candidatus Protochlamydia amoebophila]|uniref:BTB/POZ domain-containing protein n=1 Tax=Candidatus Protochlamydia amoebophila TaxID=362787 RepID=UPI001BC98B7D|nr:BTB/POZ domain-containing protein [Candidatus Protochlamydia amoebophila]
MNISNLSYSYPVNTTTPSDYQSQKISDSSGDEDNSLVNPLANLEETGDPNIQALDLSSFSQELQLSFQEGTSLTISRSQLAMLREKSLYFKTLWSGNFQETLQHPLALTQKEFTSLLNCVMDANFKLPLEKITSSIQLADYYELTEVVKNLEEQLIDGYKSQRLEPFSSTKESLVELKELLHFAQQYQLNPLKSYLEFTVVSALLNQTSQLAEFKRIINHFSDEIEALNFSNNADLTDAHLLSLKNCKNLKVLDLQRCWNFTDAGLAHLTSLTALQYLDLTECFRITDAGLAHLSPLSALQHLNLIGYDLTDAGLVHLKPLIALKHLDLMRCWNLTDAGLAHLRPLVALQHLNLTNCENITDAGLAHLTHLVALKHLDLMQCWKLTDDGLARLTSLVALQHLNLSGCSYLTDAGLAHLRPLVALQHLDLANCYELTDVGLARFKSLAATTHLDLRR